MTDGFFSRWSRRKSGLEKEVDPPKEQVGQTPGSSVLDSAASAQSDGESQTPPPMTLEDVEKIDRFAPDFSAFMKPGVDPTVQQAALKKMFTDPHFNVMDGLDIYIDDYSKPDPLTPGMLERMVQSGMLNLFRKNPDTPSDGEGGVPSSDTQVNRENRTLVAESETDLTSTGTQGSKESPSLSNPSSELEQKKT
jgi:hypothetical protein